MHTLGKSTVLLADKECSASSRINTFVISIRALELTEHLGNDSDVHFAATIATVVVEGGPYQGLNRIVTEDVFQIRTDGNSKNTTHITLAAPAQKLAAGLEDCLTVCCSQVVADTLLIGQLWPTVRVSGVLATEHLGARCYNGPVPTTLPIVDKQQLDVETTLGENVFCVSAEKIMVFVARRNIDFVHAALQSCMFGAWATAEPCLAQNCVMTAGCLGLVVAQSIRGSTKSDKSVDLTFQQDQDNDEVAPGYREPVLCLFSYEDRTVEPFAEETDATVAAVGVYCEVTFPVADGRRRSDHGIGMNAVIFPVDTLACAHPADNSDNQFGTRSALLPNHARGVSLCAHCTSDLSYIAQPVTVSPSFNWSRSVCPASLNGTYSAHVFAVLPAHRAAPGPSQHLRSADSCASGVQLRPVGGRVPVSTPVPQMVIHTGTTADTDVSALVLTRCQSMAGLINVENPAARFSGATVNHLAALNSVDRLSVIDNLQQSGSRAGRCMGTTRVDGIADAPSAECVVGIVHPAQAGKMDNNVSEANSLATTPQVSERSALPSVACTGRLMPPNPEMSHQAIMQDEWSLIATDTATRYARIGGCNGVKAPKSGSANSHYALDLQPHDPIGSPVVREGLSPRSTAKKVAGIAAPADGTLTRSGHWSNTVVLVPSTRGTARSESIQWNVSAADVATGLHARTDEPENAGLSTTATDAATEPQCRILSAVEASIKHIGALLVAGLSALIAAAVAVSADSVQVPRALVASLMFLVMIKVLTYAALLRRSRSRLRGAQGASEITILRQGGARLHLSAVGWLRRARLMASWPPVFTRLWLQILATVRRNLTLTTTVRVNIT
jgi:hypothetical protein